jgi:hypothetical protein
MPEVNTVLDFANSAPSMAVPNAFEFDVFVSYSRKGRDFCALVEGSLRAYKPPSGLNLGQQRVSVFRDQRSPRRRLLRVHRTRRDARVAVGR